MSKLSFWYETQKFRVLPRMLVILHKIGYLAQKIQTNVIPLILRFITFFLTLIGYDRQKRFSRYLLTSIVILLTGSVIFISGLLYIYFQKQLELEFKNKIMAQKGQIEILLQNRIAEVKGLLKSISSDNTIRFTIKMGKTSQLEERLTHFNADQRSVFFYVKKPGQQSFSPRMVPELFKGIEDILFIQPSRENIIEDGGRTRLVWRFNTPITDLGKVMGTLYALYDMAGDRILMDTIQRTVDGDLVMAKANNLQSLLSGALLANDSTMLSKSSFSSRSINLEQEMMITRLHGFTHIYFLASRENLLMEKKRIFFLLGLFSVLVLAVSATVSIFLGRQMSRPLDDMAAMAIQISEGKKDLSFPTQDRGYMEFNQLSKAFNYMLEKLKEAEERSRFTELLENVDDAVYLIDWQGKILEANEATYHQLNYTPEAFFHMDLFGMLPGADARLLLEQLGHRSENKKSAEITMETYHIKKEGQLIPVEIKSRVISYRGQEVILSVARDVSERRETERTLRESEERYRSVVENSHDGILILNAKHQIIYANDTLREILGYSRSEINGAEFETFLSNPSKSFPVEPDHHLPNGKEIRNHYEFDMVRKDGEKRHCIINASTIKDSAGQIRIVIQLLDITDKFVAEEEKKQLEAQLRHAQKMEAVGTLAGGIAHDFNNLLHVIHGYTELLIFRKDEFHDSDLQKLSRIQEATQRATELTQQLLTFSRKVESDRKPMDLNYEVSQIYKLLKRTIPQMIEIELILADNLETINADTAQLGQVLMNLGVNARDAMPDGGKITIQTQNISLDKRFCDRHLGAKPGDYVLLKISDTGEGMDKDRLEHIYEPFFTTKEVGKGTGLGLAIVYGIVKNHDGYIDCQSKINKGTTFNLYLPIIKQTSSLDASETIINEEILGQSSETILLVDDDETILTLGQEMLSKIGYTILTATDGKRALEIYHQKQNDIDLIILDLMMPGIGGLKCLEKLLEADPNVKILIASGHPTNKPVQDFIEAGAKGFITKPYGLDRIVRAIRDVLD